MCSAMRGMITREELNGVGVLAVIGVVLLALAPAKPALVSQVAG
jgi:hypothetical protein